MHPPHSFSPETQESLRSPNHHGVYGFGRAIIVIIFPQTLNPLQCTHLHSSNLNSTMHPPHSFSTWNLGISLSQNHHHGEYEIGSLLSSIIFQQSSDLNSAIHLIFFTWNSCSRIARTNSLWLTLSSTVTHEKKILLLMTHRGRQSIASWFMNQSLHQEIEYGFLYGSYRLKPLMIGYVASELFQLLKPVLQSFSQTYVLFLTLCYLLLNV